MIDLDEMKRDMESGTPGRFSREPRWPEIPVPVAGFCLSHFSKNTGGNEAEANARRFARVPDMEATILAQAATIKALRARVKAADELAEAVACL